MHGNDDDIKRQPNATTSGNGTQVPEIAERLKIAIKFLEQLRPGGPWVLTAILPDKPDRPETAPTITVTVQTADKVEDFISKHNGSRNLLFS